ncbi:MAG: hypothetical protein AAF645_20760 [Myxococcota bacterium]
MARALRLNNLLRAFFDQLDAAEIEIGELADDGYQIAAITPHLAIEVMTSFFVERPLAPSKAVSKGVAQDDLLFQICPASMMAVLHGPSHGPVVNITRQAYRGAGKSVQLGLDVLLEESVGKAFDCWQSKATSLETFIADIHGQLEARGVLNANGRGRFHINRF